MMDVAACAMMTDSGSPHEDPKDALMKRAKSFAVSWKNKGKVAPETAAEAANDAGASPLASPGPGNIVTVVQPAGSPSPSAAAPKQAPKQAAHEAQDEEEDEVEDGKEEDEGIGALPPQQQQALAAGGDILALQSMMSETS